MTGKNIMNILNDVIKSMEEYPARVLQYKDVCEATNGTSDLLYNELQGNVINNIVKLELALKGMDEATDVIFGDVSRGHLVGLLEDCKQQSQYLLKGLNEIRDLVVRIYPHS